MKIAVILPRFPFPLEKGDKLRAYHQIRCLAGSHEIFLFALNHKKVTRKQIEALKPYCKEIYTYQISFWSVFINLLRSFFNGTPFQAGYFHNRGIRQKIHALINVSQPDHIYCQLLRTALYARGLTFPKTLDYQDVFSTGIKRRIPGAPFYLKWLLRMEYRRLIRFERNIFGWFEFKTIITRPDRDLIPHPERDAIEIVENGVDTDYFKPLERKKEYDLIFSGNMGYPPNVGAALYLVKEIIPRVVARFPGLRVVLAGASPHPDLTALASEHVTVTGWVDDMREYYARSKIFIAPMQIGTGLQNKLLEAMAMRIPCITSPLANYALEAADGCEILVGGTPQEYADHILSLLGDSERADAIASGGYRFAVEKYNWQNAVAKLERGMTKASESYRLTIPR
ncbi:MAG: glycosyltransferase [Bacteroidales bacterium]|nr:glycosyltransferase [Bacteroidales bacterium]